MKNEEKKKERKGKGRKEQSQTEMTCQRIQYYLPEASLRFFSVEKLEKMNFKSRDERESRSNKEEKESVRLTSYQGVKMYLE